MRTSELLLVYGVVGVACAGTLLLAQRGRILDAFLLLGFWPLYGPFLIMGAISPVDEADLLGKLLPGDDAHRALNERLALAQGRVKEIDALLQRPDFSVEQTEVRQKRLLDAGDDRAAASARARLDNIHRLVALRTRFSRELTEVDELLAQLRVQSEVVRLAGRVDDGTRDLVNEIMCRVEGLDAILADDTM